MEWRDLFYFSKGERRALTLLLCLVTTAYVLLIANEEPEATPGTTVSASENRQPPVKREKYPAGTVVELNTADTTVLKKVPGIGPFFARRIVKYRELLGGFYSVTQLGEVYGIDDERYQALRVWFRTDPSLIERLPVNRLPADSLAKHPYIHYKQAKVIHRLRKQKGRLSGWENLLLLEEFNETDQKRLRYYLRFD